MSLFKRKKKPEPPPKPPVPAENFAASSRERLPQTALDTGEFRLFTGAEASGWTPSRFVRTLRKKNTSEPHQRQLTFRFLFEREGTRFLVECVADDRGDTFGAFVLPEGTGEEWEELLASADFHPIQHLPQKLADVDSGWGEESAVKLLLSFERDRKRPLFEATEEELARWAASEGYAQLERNVIAYTLERRYHLDPEVLRALQLTGGPVTSGEGCERRGGKWYCSWPDGENGRVELGPFTPTEAAHALLLHHGHTENILPWVRAKMQV